MSTIPNVTMQAFYAPWWDEQEGLWRVAILHTEEDLERFRTTMGAAHVERKQAVQILRWQLEPEAGSDIGFILARAEAEPVVEGFPGLTELFFA
jgi:hypothetical protein